MRQLSATIYSQAPDPNLGGLKNQEKISQFCAVGIVAKKYSNLVS